ncbi:prepilin-type N-terminal cleavage/methylation domain-containing protein [Planococcus salinarum]|nr:prepilin-type N-terminal cleavage/methylation domain-containing protein [Planococcus salinarum]
MQKKLKNEKGMTLIELLAVIVILAIIAAIAIPAIGTIIENSRNGAVKADYQNALSAANLYFTENPGETTVTAGGLLDGVALTAGTTASYLDDIGSLAPAVEILKVTGGNTISGSATASGKTYTISSAMTNAELSDKTNAEFTGTTITP